MSDYRINTRSFIAPGLAWLTGLMLVIIFAPNTDYLIIHMNHAFIFAWVMISSTFCITLLQPIN
jgi:hypothetical protein